MKDATHSSDERRLLGGMRLTEEFPCFLLPLFEDPSNFQNWCVQELDEVDGRIAGFNILEGEVSGVLPVSEGPNARVGGEQLFVASVDGQSFIVGTLNNVRGDLKKLLERCVPGTPIRTQIIELIGTNEEKQVARAEMRQVIASKSGEATAYSFLQRSVLRVLLWDKLLMQATSAEAARRILRARSDIDIKVGIGNQITVDLAGIAPSDIRTTAGVLSIELEAELSAMSVISQHLGGEHANHVEVADTIGQIISQITSLPRQEERIARLIREAVDNPIFGRMVLLEYPFDRAKFMNSAVRQIRGVLNEVMHNQSNTQYEMAALTQRLIKEVYPIDKGLFLVYLSKHLGHVPAIRQLVNGVAMKSASTFVVPYRQLIIDNLAEGERRTTAEQMHAQSFGGLFSSFSPPGSTVS